MDNFRRPKRTRRNSMDGMIRPRRAADAGSMGGFHRRQAAYRPAPPPNTSPVGNFNQSDGFRPSAPPTMAAPGLRPRTGSTVAQAPVAPRKTKAKKPKTQRNWRSIAKRSALAMVVVLVLGGGYMGFHIYGKARKVLKGGGNAAALQKNVDPTRLKGEGDGRINIMALGKGGEGHEAPDLTDTLIIASIDPIQKDAALLSIPRDLWVKVPGNGSMKINAVYATEKSKVLAKRKYPNQQKDAEKAGIEGIEKTLEATLGVPIHYYTMVDFQAFRKAIDTVGGVDVNVKERLYDPTVAWENNWNPVLATAGPNHFNGQRALLYARSRQTSTRGDFDRAVRQREIILALKEKVLSMGTYSNPVKVTQLIDAFGDHVQSNFTIDEIMRLYELGKGIQGSKVASLGLTDEPNVLVTTGNIGGQSVVLPKAGAGNYKDIQSFVRNALRDSYLKQENASIAIFNGTETAGLATARSEDLKSFGYNITQVADAPTKGNAQTILVDMRSGTKKYTKHYLEKRLKVKATSKLPAGITPGTADFVIILGQNEVTQ